MIRSLFDEIKRAKKALIIGIGGAGDILGTIPTMVFLKKMGLETIIGSIIWERIIVDPKPGPRSIEELENVEIISSSVCLADKNVKMKHGPVPQAAYVSKILSQKVVLIDMTKNPLETAKGIKEAMEKLNIDLLFGIDVGGDVLATGYEKDLRSPLADSFMLSAFSKIENSILGIFGIACDGELRREEVEERISEVAKIGGYIGAIGMFKEALEIMEKLSEGMYSEASKLPIEASKGYRGIVKIREGTREANVTIEATITYYLDLIKAYEISPLAESVVNAKSLDEANEILHKNFNLFTELDFEREAYKRKTTSYRDIYKI